VIFGGGGLAAPLYGAMATTNVVRGVRGATGGRGGATPASAAPVPHPQERSQSGRREATYNRQPSDCRAQVALTCPVSSGHA
jgi:hypothetical protein